MQTRDQQFLKKLSTLPEEAQYFFESSLSGVYCRSLGAKYGVTNEFFLDVLINMALLDFDFKQLELHIVQKLHKDTTEARKMAVDILGMLFMPISEYLNGKNVSNEIKTRGGDPNFYHRYIKDYIEDLEERKFEAIEEIINLHDNVVVPDEEAEIVLELLENGLVALVKDGAEKAMTNLNGGLTFLLYRSNEFKQNAVRALHRNNEIVSSKKFMLHGKEHHPSLRNWLQYFVEVRGSGAASNIETAKFISDSENTKDLSEKEKRDLSRLLQTYGNIKFFPQSLENIPPERWEIVPSDKAETPTRTFSPPVIKKGGSEGLVDELKGNIDDYAPGSLEREVLEEEDERDREYHKLLLLQKKYPEGSLERRAVDEEIRKMAR
jgi:hypothetical protein